MRDIHFLANAVADSIDIQALILFSHGSADPEWSWPFACLQAHLAERLGGKPVVLAYLPPASPTFGDVAAQLAQMGIREITVVPLFLARGGHVKKDLPELVAQAAAMHGLSFRILPVLGEVEILQNAITDWVMANL